MAASVDGWAWMKQQTLRFTRSLRNQGAVTNDLIAYSYTEAQQMVQRLAVEAGVRWAVKSASIDDVGLALGTETATNERLLLIEDDLGITDMMKIDRLWRLGDDSTTRPALIPYVPSAGSTAPLILDSEVWTEAGGNNAAGNFEIGVRILNWGLESSGELRVDYWFSPPTVTADFFTEVDSSGNYTKKPTLPRPVWTDMLNYAHLLILETTDDQSKASSIWRRFQGPAGIEQRLRNYFGSFQTGSPETVIDRFSEE